MIKPKVALVKDGFLPAGSENKRGRLSLDAINRLKELAASGMPIEGYSVSKGTDSTGPVVSKVEVDPNKVYDVPNEMRSPDEWTVHNSDGPLVIGIKGVCSNCHSSFTYCGCGNPSYLLDGDTPQPVYFKPIRK